MQHEIRRSFMRNALIILTLFWLAPMLSSASVVVKSSALVDELAFDHSVASFAFDDSPSFDSETPDALTYTVPTLRVQPCADQLCESVHFSTSRFVRTSAIRAPPY